MDVVWITLVVGLFVYICLAFSGTVHVYTDRPWSPGLLAGGVCWWVSLAEGGGRGCYRPG